MGEMAPRAGLESRRHRPHIGPMQMRSHFWRYLIGLGFPIFCLIMLRVAHGPMSGWAARLAESHPLVIVVALVALMGPLIWFGRIAYLRRMEERGRR